MRAVIVGSGIAALSARSTIISCCPGADVLLVSRERELPYSKVALAKYVAGYITKDQVFLPAVVDPDRLILGAHVEQIDRERHSIIVRTQSGRTALEYDYLVLATGSKPNRRFGMPFWTCEDACAVHDSLEAGQSAAVVGGGFVGIHLASALRERGLRVSLFEKEATLLPGRVPEKAAEFINDRFEACGVKVMTGFSLSAASCHERGWALEFAEGGILRELAFDHSFDCTGATPDTALAQAAGLLVSCQGILVDQYQRTSDGSIFAAGDCAAVRYLDGSVRSAGLWYAAAEQGTVAGWNISGRQVESRPFVPWNTFELPGESPGATLHGVSFGSIAASQGDTVIETGDPAKGTYRYAVLNGNRVKGYFALGDASGAGHLLRLALLQEPLATLLAPGAGDVTPSPFWAILGFEASLALPASTKVSIRG